MIAAVPSTGLPNHPGSLPVRLDAPAAIGTGSAGFATDLRITASMSRNRDAFAPVREPVVGTTRIHGWSHATVRTEIGLNRCGRARGPISGSR